MSIQIEHANLGQIVFVTFYGHQDTTITMRRLEDLITKLEATGFCFIIGGDFNISSDDMSQWLPTNHPYMQLREGGDSCVTANSVSTIDYFLFQGPVCAMQTSIQTLDTGLATHRPVNMMFDSWNNSEFVKWMPRAIRPEANMVFGPTLGEACADKWGVLHDRIVAVLPIGPLHFGMENTSEDHTKVVDGLWEHWQHLANIEIRANFSIPLDHKLGGAFNIKTGPLHEAMAPKLCHRASSLIAHNWAYRRICEARADAKRQGPRRVVSSHLLAKRYSHLADCFDKNLLPNGIGIAIDLHAYWTGRETPNLDISTNGIRCSMSKLGLLSPAAGKKGLGSIGRNWRKMSARALPGLSVC